MNPMKNSTISHAVFPCDLLTFVNYVRQQYATPVYRHVRRSRMNVCAHIHIVRAISHPFARAIMALGHNPVTLRTRTGSTIN